MHNLSAFNRELVNYFVNILNQQKNHQRLAPPATTNKRNNSIIKTDDEQDDDDDDDIGNARNYLKLTRAKTQKQLHDDSSITPKIDI